MTGLQWWWSLIAVPGSLIALRIVLWNFGRRNWVSNTVLVLGLTASALCVVLAIIWRINADTTDWRPPRNNEPDEVGGLILWTLYWNAFAGLVTAGAIRLIDKLIMEGLFTRGS